MIDQILNIDEMNNLAKQIAKIYKNGGFIGLIGDLGAGKTTLAKRICKEFNITENIKSPTFTYVIEYDSGDIKVYHFDVYRITNIDELYEIGFEDYMQEDNVLVIVEWANNILSEMPDDTLYVEIKYNDEFSRKVSTYRIENGELEYVNICDNNNN